MATLNVLFGDTYNANMNQIQSLLMDWTKSQYEKISKECLLEAEYYGYKEDSEKGVLFHEAKIAPSGNIEIEYFIKDGDKVLRLITVTFGSNSYSIQKHRKVFIKT